VRIKIFSLVLIRLIGSVKFGIYFIIIPLLEVSLFERGVRRIFRGGLIFFFLPLTNFLYVLRRVVMLKVV